MREASDVQEVQYDGGDRLTRSSGVIYGEQASGLAYSYEAEYAYSKAGRITRKVVDSRRLGTAMGTHEVRYDNTYHYGNADNPYAITHVDNTQGSGYIMEWNSCGGLSRASGLDSPSERLLCWTEDSRLQAFMERGEGGSIAAYYNYAADGTRNLKLTSPRMDMQVNAADMENPPLMFPTLYASPLITLTRHGYTKHYFEGDRRICSKIGGGFKAIREVAILYQSTPVAGDYTKMYLRQREGIRASFSHDFGIDPHIADFADLRQVLIENEINRDEAEPAYFYHSDHLGSAAYLTRDGHVTQTLNYLPYGEDWVELNFLDPIDTTRIGIYRFNGKEKDYESGFHYYGARFYWSEVLTGWLSVDPMADKYPNTSPYNYCIWNPIKFIDSDGKELDEPQRRAAIAKAKEYEMANRVDPSKEYGKNNSKNTYLLGGKGNPGEKVDCSGLTSACIVAGGEPDPVRTGSGGGVQRTASATTKVENNNAEPGNVAIFSGKAISD